MKATIKLRIDTTDEQAALLEEAAGLYAGAFNAVGLYGWQNGISSAYRLHHALYYTIRGEIPELPSQLVVSAIRRASEALKSAFDRRKKGQPVSRSHMSRHTIRYDKRSMSVKLDAGVVSLATTGGRVVAPVRMSSYYKRYLSWETRSADLVWDAGKRRFYLHLVVESEAPRVELNDEYLGVDRGIVNFAVSTRPAFYSGSEVKRVVSRHRYNISRLQSKGTKSARRRLKQCAGRWKRFQRDVNHRVSRDIVESVDPGATIVLEKLTGIRESCKQRGKAQRGAFHNWSFYQLERFILYKAERKGVRVVFVDPSRTSHICPSCGCDSDSNRPARDLFRCTACGLVLNADLAAARNIRDRGMSSFPRSTVNRPIAAGACA